MMVYDLMNDHVVMNDYRHVETERERERESESYIEVCGFFMSRYRLFTPFLSGHAEECTCTGSTWVYRMCVCVYSTCGYSECA